MTVNCTDCYEASELCNWEHNYEYKFTCQQRYLIEVCVFIRQLLVNIFYKETGKIIAIYDLNPLRRYYKSFDNMTKTTEVIDAIELVVVKSSIYTIKTLNRSYFQSQLLELWQFIVDTFIVISAKQQAK